MAVAANADDYTVGRVNHFFTANNQTPLDGNLTGQCVTLVKWFMAQMTSVPSPFAARGDARYVGKSLVAQGHAVEVPWADRRRGDIICYEYGIYGHIAVQLSGGRVFESNVNWAGVASKLVDGDRVYASRIGSEAESWRHDAHVYRIKTYNEEGASMGKVGLEMARILTFGIIGRNGTDGVPNALGGTTDGDLNANHVNQEFNFDYIRGLYNSGEGQNWRSVRLPELARKAAIYDKLEPQLVAANNAIADLNAKVAQLSTRPTKEELDALSAAAAEANKKAQEAQTALEKVTAERQADVETGNRFLRWLGGILNRS